MKLRVASRFQLSGWQKLAKDSKPRGTRSRLSEVLVDYKGFAKYCRDAKQEPSYIMLMAYAVTKSIE